MKVFSYKVRDSSSSKVIRGKLKAENKTDCIKMLKDKGYTVLETKESILDFNLDLNKSLNINMVKVKKKDLCEFFDQLSFMLYAGMSMYTALETLRDFSTNKAVVHLVTPIADDVKEGMSFDDSLSKSKYVPENIVHQIKAGIDSGSVSDALNRIVLSLEQELELSSKVVTASIYPAFIGIVMVVVLIVLMIFVVPSMAQQLESMGGDMPGITLFVLGVSEFMQNYILQIIISIVLIVVAFKLIYSKISAFRMLMARLILKVPIIGELTLKLDLSKFCRGLSSLDECGITLSKSLQITNKVIKNGLMSKKVGEVAELVEIHGMDLSSAMAKVGGFPQLMTQLVLVGVSSGNLTEVLNKIAVQYEKDVDALIKRATSMLEPLMIVVIGVVVGTVVISMFLPMFSLLDTI